MARVIFDGSENGAQVREAINTMTGELYASGYYIAVANFSALPAASEHTGEIYTVLADQGTWILGTKNAAGLYYSDGAAWTRLGPALNAAAIYLAPIVGMTAVDVQAAVSELMSGKAPTLGEDDNYVTDTEKANLHAHSNKTALDAVSGTNTGDQTYASFVQMAYAANPSITFIVTGTKEAGSDPPTRSAVTQQRWDFYTNLGIPADNLLFRPVGEEVSGTTMSLANLTMGAATISSITLTRTGGVMSLDSLTLGAPILGTVTLAEDAGSFEFLLSDLTLGAADVGTVAMTRIGGAMALADLTLGAPVVGTVAVSKDVSGNEFSADLSTTLDGFELYSGTAPFFSNGSLSMLNNAIVANISMTRGFYIEVDAIIASPTELESGNTLTVSINSGPTPTSAGGYYADVGAYADEDVNLSNSAALRVIGTAAVVTSFGFPGGHTNTMRTIRLEFPAAAPISLGISGTVTTTGTHNTHQNFTKLYISHVGEISSRLFAVRVGPL